MTQTEAVVKALEILGGRSELKWITLVALHLDNVCWDKAEQPEANIRRIVRNTPKKILVVKKGVYELSSHAEEIQSRIMTTKQMEREMERLSKITLEKVVEYAKSRHDYSEAKPYVDMLNKLYRSKSTEDELALIDSIERYFIERDNPQVKHTAASVSGNNEGVVVGGNLGVKLSEQLEQKLVDGLIENGQRRIG